MSRKLQTDEEKKTAALLASRAHSLWLQGLLSELRAIRDGNSSNEQGKHQNQALIAIVALETELGKGHKLCKEVSLSLSLSISLSLPPSLSPSLPPSLPLSLALPASLPLPLSVSLSLSQGHSQERKREGFWMCERKERAARVRSDDT